MPEALAVGIDLCAVSRMERAVQKEHFLKRVFTQEERDYLLKKGRGMAQSAAAMFAAKEAVAKALGTGFSGGVMPGQIGVTHSELGAPGAVLTGAALARMQALGAGRVLLSLTHEGDQAMAIALLIP